MDMFMITFRSITPAQRSERILRQNGIRCALQRTPRWMEEQGCGYCVRFRHWDAGKVTGMLQRNQIPFRRLYGQTAEGSMEEIVL